MSATFKLAAKKKYSQNDLRKLMNDQKPKAQQQQKKIDSPLAKYNDLGQLTCILCKSIVRSADVWKVHVNAKQHRQNIESAKKLKASTNNFTAVPQSLKRAASPPPIIFEDHPFKKPKGILKNTTTATNVPTASAAQDVAPNDSRTGAVPSDFFDAKPSSSGSHIQTANYFEATLQKTSIRKDLINIRQRDTAGPSVRDDVAMDVDQSAAGDETLPEGFFDDPVKDAKARNLDYKDPIEEEWEKFQKEIKAASNFSNAIIAEDQEEATTERQIDEIDEQIRNWSRVLHLEKKKEEVVDKEKQASSHKSSANKKQSDAKRNENDGESDEDNDEDFDEYLDWRAKRSSIKHK